MDLLLRRDFSDRRNGLQGVFGQLCVLLLSDPEFRMPFLTHLMPLYGRLRSMHPRLLDRISVQIFTVGSLADTFVEKMVVRSLLTSLAETLTRSSINSSTRRGRSRLTVDCVNGLFRDDRLSPYFEICIDLRYMLRQNKVSADAAVVPANLEPLVRVLNLTQRMHPCTRRTGSHVEFEADTWMIAFELESEVAEVFSLISSGLWLPGHSPNSHHELLSALVGSLSLDFLDQVCYHYQHRPLRQCLIQCWFRGHSAVPSSMCPILRCRFTSLCTGHSPLCVLVWLAQLPLPVSLGKP
jgi:hypothetical protein